MSAIGRLHHVIYDTPDPMALARFWSAVLGQPITYASDDFVVVAPHEDHSGTAFQLVRSDQAPVWRDPTRPQQIHHDVMVDDVAAAEEQVEALGARRLVSPDGSVWADPVRATRSASSPGRAGRPRSPRGDRVGFSTRGGTKPHTVTGQERPAAVTEPDGRTGATNRFGVIVASRPA